MSLMSFICFIIPTPLAPVLSARSRQWSTGALAVLLSRTESRGQTGPRAAAGDRDAAGRGRQPHDPSAVSVWIDGLLPKRSGERACPGLLAAQEREGKPIALEGVIVKGAMRGDGGSRLSVVLRYDPEGFGLWMQGRTRTRRTPPGAAGLTGSSPIPRRSTWCGGCSPSGYQGTSGPDRPGAERRRDPVPVGGRPCAEPSSDRGRLDRADGRIDPVQPAVHRPSGMEPAAHRSPARRPGRYQPGLQTGAALEPSRRLGHLRRPAHPPLVSEADFVAAQEIRVARGPAPRGASSTVLAASGARSPAASLRSRCRAGGGAPTRSGTLVGSRARVRRWSRAPGSGGVPAGGCGLTRRGGRQGRWFPAGVGEVLEPVLVLGGGEVTGSFLMAALWVAWNRSACTEAWGRHARCWGLRWWSARRQRRCRRAAQRTPWWRPLRRRSLGQAARPMPGPTGPAGTDGHAENREPRGEPPGARAAGWGRRRDGDLRAVGSRNHHRARDLLHRRRALILLADPFSAQGGARRLRRTQNQPGSLRRELSRVIPQGLEARTSIDITFIPVGLIEKRLLDRYPGTAAARDVRDPARHGRRARAVRAFVVRRGVLELGSRARPVIAAEAAVPGLRDRSGGGALRWY